MSFKGKRILSMLLAICMILSTFTFEVSAVETVPTSISKVSKVVSTSTGIGSDITITAANIYQVGNYYGKTRILIELSNLDYANNTSYYACFDVNGVQYTSYVYKKSETVGIAYWDYEEALEGNADISVTIQNQYSNPTIVYSPAIITTYLSSNFSPTIQELNSELQTINNSEMTPYVRVMLPVDYVTDNVTMKLESVAGDVFAVSNQEQNKPSFYKTTIDDTRYNEIFIYNNLRTEVKVLYSTLYIGKPLEEAVYNIGVYDINNQLLYSVPNKVSVTALPYVSISTHSGEFTSIEAGSPELYATINIDGGYAKDYNLALYDNNNELIAQSSGNYKIDYAHNNSLAAVYKMELVAGKSIVEGQYTLKLVTNMDCVYEGDVTVYVNNNNRYVNKVVTSNSRYANILVYGSGYNSNIQYKAVLEANGIAVAEKLVMPVNNIFEIEFTDELGNVIPLENDTNYFVEIRSKDNYGEWQNSGPGGSFYNRFPEEGTSGDSRVYYGSAYFRDNNLSGYLYINNSVVNDYVDTSLFKIEAISSLGDIYTFDNLLITTNVYDEQTYLNIEQAAPVDMPYGNYRFKIYYNNNEMMLDNNNIYYKSYYSQYNNAPSISYSSFDINNLEAVYGVNIYGLDVVINPQLKLYDSFNSTISPLHTIDLVEQNGRYIIATANSSGIDFFKKYNGLVYVDGKHIGNIEDEFFAPKDMVEDTTVYTVELNQSANGTISASVQEGTKGTMVYINNLPEDGFQLKPNSVRVNNEPIMGRSFVLTENSTVTAEFEPVFIPKYSIEKGSNIFYGDISIDKSEAAEGETVSITDIPNIDYKLNELKYRDKNYNYTAIDAISKSFIMPGYDVVVEASFSYKNSYMISLPYIANGNVSLDSSSYVKEGSTVNLTVAPYNGYKLGTLYYVIEGTSEQITIENYSFVMPSNDITIYAEFVQMDSYSIIIDDSVSGYINTSPYGTASEGSVVTVYTNMPTGLKLVENSLCYKINGEGEEIKIENNTFIMPNNNITIYAQVETDTVYNINIVQPANGTITAKSTAYFNEFVDVIVIPESGYRFKQGSLKVNGISVDTTWMIGFNMPEGNVTITCEFEQLPAQQYNVNFMDYAYGHIELRTTTAIENQLVTFNVVPDYGYKVKEGSVRYIISGTDEVIYLSEYSFIMPAADVTITAEYEVANQYNINIDYALNGTIIASPSGYVYEGTHVHVVAEPNYGYKLKEGSLSYKNNGTGDIIPINNLDTFEMPSNDIIIYAEFEPINSTHSIKINETSNGDIEVNKSTAPAGESVSVTITSNPGYSLLNNVIWINGNEHYVSSNVINFVMPDEDVTISAEFVKHDLLNKDNFNLNRNSWRLRLSIPQDKISLVNSLDNYNKYVTTVIKNSDGNVVLENNKVLVDNVEDYNLYRTSFLTLGDYIAEITVGDYDNDIYLGETEVSFGDYLEIESIYVEDYYNQFTTSTRNFTTIFHIPHLFTDLDNFDVRLVEIETGNIVADTTSKKYIYYDEKNEKSTTADTNYNIDSAELQFDFVTKDFLSVDKTYAFEFVYNKDILLGEWVNNLFTVTSQPRFFNGEMTDDTVTISTEGLTAGNYNVFLNSSESIEYILVVDENGVGTIDISTNKIDGNYANFKITIGGFDFHFSADRRDENNYPYISLDNSVFYGRSIGNDWANYILPVDNIISFDIFNYSNYDMIYLKSGSILKKIGVDALVDGRGSIDYNFEQNTHYEIGLVNASGEIPLTSFAMLNNPFISTFNFMTEGFYGNILKIPFEGTINIDDISKLKFYYSLSNMEEISILNITDYEITLDVTNAPSGIFNIRIVYPNYLNGQDFDVITPRNLSYYRIYDESAVITYTGEDNGIYYAEGLDLNNITTAQAKIYKAVSGELVFVKESELVRRSETRLEVPQNTFADLDVGKYVIYYIIDGRDKAAQTVTYSNDIQKFNVTFESNGGTEVTSMSGVTKGTTINQPTAPTKAGFGFNGWYKDVSLTQPWNFDVDMVTSDIALYAKWVENAYTVSFLDYDGSVINTQSVVHGNPAIAPEVPVRKGYTFAGWDKEFSNIIADTIITATYTPNKYTVTFNSNGGTAVDSQSIAYGDAIIQPPAPTKEGYGFGGWFEDPGFMFTWNFEKDGVAVDTTLHAKWIENAYTVTFTDFDESVINTQSVLYGESATAPINPSREGYTFKGWDKTFDNITGNTTIKAVYDINKYTVKFVDFNGVELKKEVVEYNLAATAPATPTRMGYIFKNWDKSFDKIIGDITVTAVYEVNKYSVTFVDWNDVVLKTQNDVAYGTSAIAPVNPIREGYMFTGWDKAFDNITGDLTIKAIYIAGKFNVNFNSMGGSSVTSIIGVERDSKIVEPVIPTRTGYEFVGWYKDFALTKQWNFNVDVVTGNTVLYAKWESKTYNITVNDEITGGIIKVKSTAKAGEIVSVYAEPNEGNTIKSIWWSSTGAYASDISIYNMTFVMPARDVEINAEFNEMAELTVNVNKANSPYYVYIYGNDNNFYGYSYVSEVTTQSAITTGSSITTSTSITVPDRGNYTAYINMGEEDNWFWDYKNISVNGPTEVNFNIPITYSITGKVDFINGPTSNVYVSAYSNGGYGSSYVRSDGSYEIKGLIPGDYTVEVNFWNSNFKGNTTQRASVTNKNLSDINFTLIKGADLRVTLTKTTGTPAFKAYATLYKLNGSYWSYVSSSIGSGTGDMLFDGAITDIGKYKVVLEYLENKNYTSPRFVSSPVEFEVTEDDIAKGTIGKTLVYSDPIDAAVALSGNGNLVATDVKTAQKGSYVSLTVRYKNNGNTEISPIFTIDLPEGITITSDKTHSAVLSPNESGEYKVVLNIGNVNSEMANIDVNVSLDGKTYDFGDANINITRVTLNSPVSVKTNSAFKAYGEATEGSIIKIKNALTGQVYATVSPQGKFYTADIKLSEGITKLVAEALLDNTLAQSKSVEVEAKSEPIIVGKVYKDGSELQLNSRLGVYVFSQYVDMSLMGFDFTLRTEFENSDEISKVTYHFADMDFEADSNFSATFAGWGGAGLKPITATITTKSGEVLEFIIAEVTVLIDPSGIVTNAVTGEPMEGVLMTCWVLNPKTNIWEIWDAENYGQVNPHYTDKDGKYGWMVPEGKYRITAKINNFEDYDTILDEKFSNGFETTIIIPPPRDDVNFSMIPDTFIISKSSEINGGTITVKETAQFTETVSIIANPDAGKQLKNIIVDGKAIEGTSFVMPAKNIIVTAEFEDITVVPENPSNGGSSGGGSGKGPGVPTVLNPAEAEYTVNSQGKVTITSEQLAKAESLTIKGDVNLIIDKKTLKSIGADKELSVTIKKADVSSLNSEDKKLIGDRPIYEINIKSGTKSINKFDGNIKIEIPYTLSQGEKANFVRVYYISDSGVATRVTNGYYNEESKSVIFITDHFSKYAIGYSEVEFKDVEGWAEQYIYYLADRAIVSGKGNGMFAPNNSITRAEFVKILSGVAGVDLSKYTSAGFTDVKAGDWFEKAVAWASETGITSGVSDKEFAPNAKITREQMAAMIVRFTQQTGYKLNELSPYNEFADQDMISSYAIESVVKVQQAGLIVGKENNMFDPKGNATRAETSKVLAILMQGLR